MRNAILSALAVALYAVIGARFALWIAQPAAVGAVWGAVVGVMFTHGDRRHFPRSREAPVMVQQQ